MRRKVIAAIVIVALVGGAGWFFAASSARRAAARNQVQYVPAVVRRGDIRVTISGSGPVKAVNGLDVKSSQSGTVAQLLAQNGDQVKAGQVIMVLDSPSLQASLQQAQIDFDNSRASLDNLLNPKDTAVRAQQLKVDNARLTLQQRQADVANLRVIAPRSGVISSVKTTEGSSVTANALLFTIYDDTTPTFIVGVSQGAAPAVKPGQNATVEIAGFGRFEGTVQPTGAAATPVSGNKDATAPVAIALPPIPGIRAGMVGQATLEVPELTYLVQGNGSVENDAVEVRAEVAGTVSRILVKEGDRVKAGDLLQELTNESLQIQLLQAENDLKTQEENLAALVNPASDPQGQILTLTNKLEQSRINLQSRQRDVEDLQVKAPVDGQISGLNLSVGERVNPNQVLFRVADYTAMQVTITVDELDIALVKAGQPAQITLDALPGRQYQGKVLTVNPEGVFKNDIATFEVTVLVENPEGLMAGMNATVNVVVEEKTGVLWLPSQAVQVRQGRAFVQVLENNQPVPRAIQIGARSDQQTEITGGLREGDRVVLTTMQSTNATRPGNGMFPGAGFPGSGFRDGGFPGGGMFPGGGSGNRSGGGQTPSGR